MRLSEPNRAPPVSEARRQRLLRLQRDAATLEERLGAIRTETRRLVAIEGTRPLTVAERAQAVRLKLEAEGLLLEMRRLRVVVEETRRG